MDSHYVVGSGSGALRRLSAAAVCLRAAVSAVVFSASASCGTTRPADAGSGDAGAEASDAHARDHVDATITDATLADGGCIPASLDCEGEQPRFCNGTGAWQSIGPACSNQVCVAGACVGVCSARSTRCAGNAVQTCGQDGTWGPASACSGTTCIAGVCSGVCVAGALQCEGNGVSICSAAGTWGAAVPCANQACVAGTCTGVCAPTATQCMGNAVQLCNATGAWGVAMPCVATTCVAGACSGGCAVGMVRCVGNAVEACDATGAWGAPAACVAQACVAGACTGVCEPGATQCAAGQVQTCDASGVWSAPATCTAPAGEICLGSACASCPMGQSPCGAACTNLTTDTSNCGACGTVCGPYVNAAASCQATGCGYSCAPGFLDCDGVMNGCEVDGLTDAAHCGSCGRACSAGQMCTGSACACDPTFVANAATGVFVDSARGNDLAGLGTIASPYATIAHGVLAARTAGVPNIYLAPGAYAETLVLTDTPLGVSIQGGWLAGTFARDCAANPRARTTIQGGQTAVSAANVTHLSGFTNVTISAAPGSYGWPGASSIGVLVAGAGSRFFLTSSDVTAGAGGAGLSAMNGSWGRVGASCTTTADGANGTNGGAGANATTAGTFGPTGFTPRSGGAGADGTGGNSGAQPPPACVSYDTCGGGGCDIHCTGGTASACAASGSGGCGGGPGSGGGGAWGGGASVALLVDGVGATVAITASGLHSSVGGSSGRFGYGGSGAGGAAGGGGLCTPYTPYYEDIFGACGFGFPVYGCRASSTYLECGFNGHSGGSGGQGGQGGGGAGGPSYALVTGGGATASMDTGSTLLFAAGGLGVLAGGSAAQFVAP